MFWCILCSVQIKVFSCNTENAGIINSELNRRRSCNEKKKEGKKNIYKTYLCGMNVVLIRRHQSTIFGVCVFRVLSRMMAVAWSSINLEKYWTRKIVCVWLQHKKKRHSNKKTRKEKRSNNKQFNLMISIHRHSTCDYDHQTRETKRNRKIKRKIKAIFLGCRGRMCKNNTL